MNNVILIGRITTDIEVKYANNGNAFILTSIAVKRDYKNPNGEYDADFIRLIIAGKTTDFVSKYVKKGDLVSVRGAIRTDKYTDKNGNNRIDTKVSVNEISKLVWGDNNTTQNVNANFNANVNTTNNNYNNSYNNAKPQTSINDSDIDLGF